MPLERTPWPFLWHFGYPSYVEVRGGWGPSWGPARPRRCYILIILFENKTNSSILHIQKSQPSDSVVKMWGVRGNIPLIRFTSRWKGTCADRRSGWRKGAKGTTIQEGDNHPTGPQGQISLESLTELQYASFRAIFISFRDSLKWNPPSWRTACLWR